jgi:hypothetical protein
MSIPPKKPLNPKESATRPLRAHLEQIPVDFTRSLRA